MNETNRCGRETINRCAQPLQKCSRALSNRQLGAPQPPALEMGPQHSSRIVSIIALTTPCPSSKPQTFSASLSSPAPPPPPRGFTAMDTAAPGPAIGANTWYVPK